MVPAPTQAAEFQTGDCALIQIGFGPGGGYVPMLVSLHVTTAASFRAIRRSFPKNMPGAGSLRAANHIYNLTARDGIEIGTFSASAAMEPMMGNDQAKFDTSKFGWIGSMNQDIAFCGALGGTGHSHIVPGNAQEGRQELIFGSAGPAAVTHQHALILRNVLGANIRVISGYQGQKEVNLAMQRGEVHGVCGLFTSAIKVQSLSDVQAGRLKLFLQMGPKVTNEFGEVPDVFEFVKTDEDRKVLELHFKQTILGRPFAASPSLPKDRLAALRRAFAATTNDPEFVADAKKFSLDIDIATSDEVERLLTVSPTIRGPSSTGRGSRSADSYSAATLFHHRARRRGSRSPPACRPSCAGCRRATAPSR